MDITRHLLQDATLWESTPDAFGGHTFGAPIPVKCRWEECAEVFVSPIDRRELVSSAVVFVDRDMSVDDYLFLGTSVAADPTQVVGAYKVQRFDRVPNLRNLQHLRTVYL